MGFIEETGAAQHYRDARIAPIYEGTNGIQAADFVGRKLAGDDGEGLKSLLADIRAECGDESALMALADAVEIGRASCRVRVCQYMLIAVVAGTIKKQRKEKKDRYKLK